jgi:hypothetical protein
MDSVLTGLSEEGAAKLKERRTKVRVASHHCPDFGILRAVCESLPAPHNMFCVVASMQDELLGKIEDRCRRLGKEVPFGLPTASVEALRKHLEVLNSQIAARAQNNLK